MVNDKPSSTNQLKEDGVENQKSLVTNLSRDTMNNEGQLDKRRSQVRIWVTYTMTALYSVTALLLIWYLLNMQKIEAALAIFAGISSTTTGIIAFWFGTRQGQKKESTNTVPNS